MRGITACVAVGVLLSTAPAFAQAKAKATAPEIPFESVAGFFKLPPGLYLGEGTGVATNSKLYSSNSNSAESIDHGEIYKIQLNGQVVGRFGRAGKMPKEFGMVNSIDCRTENDLVLGEIWNWRAQKVTLKK